MGGATLAALDVRNSEMTPRRRAAHIDRP